MIRPAALSLLKRWQEVILAAAVALIGLWLLVLGGYILWPLGGAVLALAVSMAVLALRRLRFSSGQGAIGMVEVDEAQIGYFSPEAGGFISLQDMIELRLLRVSGRQMWRLKQADGQALLIPVNALGAGALFDAFAALPDMDTAALVDSLSDPATEFKTIWRRAGKGITPAG